MSTSELEEKFGYAIWKTKEVGRLDCPYLDGFLQYLENTSQLILFWVYFTEHKKKFQKENSL